ncbi:MAG: lipid-binding SYLF domain-containing protein [Gemmatimonadota bacterium]
MKNNPAMRVSRRRFTQTALAAGAWLVVPAARADDAADARDVVDNARITIQELARDKNFGAMRAGLKQARGVLIFPQIIKGAFFVGGSGGTGVLLARDGNRWVGPAFYTIGSASIGIQFGGEAAQVVILVNNQKALDGLYSDHFKIGSDASVAAGPIGQGGGLAFTTDMTSFSKSKGAFAGISFEGSVLDVRGALNDAYYGGKATPLDILVRHSVSSKQADALRAAVAAATG